MLLGASSDIAGLEIDMELVVTPGAIGDPGVPHGALLLQFATAANRDTDDLGQSRERLRNELGEDALVEAAATVAAFNGLVRVADGTGIQLDPTMLSSTVESRRRLGIDRFSGAANSAGASEVPRTGSRGGGAADLFL